MTEELKITLVEGSAGGGTTRGGEPLGDAAARASRARDERRDNARRSESRNDKQTEAQTRATNLLIRAIERLAQAIGLGGVVSTAKQAYTVGSDALAAVGSAGRSRILDTFATFGATRFGVRAGVAGEAMRDTFRGQFTSIRPVTAGNLPAGTALARANTVDALAVRGTTQAAGGAVAGGAARAGLMASLFNPITIGIAAVVAAFAALAIGTKKLFGVFDSQARQLERYSPALAGVAAERNVNMELARMDRAERIGPQLAQISAARARLEEALYEAVTQILELILKAAPVFEAMLDTLTAILKILIASKEIAEAQLFFWDNNERQEAIDASIDAMQAVADIFRQNVPPNHRMDPVLNELMNLDARRNPRGPGGNNPNGNGQNGNGGNPPAPNPNPGGP